MIKKVFFSITLSLFGLTLFSNNAFAALVNVDNSGKVYWAVLGSETDSTLPIPKPKNLEVKSVAEIANLPQNALISLVRDNDKVELNVTTDSGRSKTDVTNYKENLVEIEATDETKHVKISSQNGHFSINQNNVTANTNFPITINAPEKKIMVGTSSGDRYLSLLPYDALSGVLKANILSLKGLNSVNLTEGDKGELEYFVDGKKEVGLFNVISFDVPVKVQVSATTGEVLKIDAPIWYKILGFVFT